MGVNPTRALVISQVVLSLVLPVPVIALVAFTRRRSLMGEFVNHRLTSAVAGLAAAVILVLNVVFLMHVFSLPLPLGCDSSASADLSRWALILVGVSR